MKYFKSRTHFLNYIKKAVRDNDRIDTSRLLNLGVYWESTVKMEMTDEFGFAIKGDPTLLYENRFWQWLRESRFDGFSIDRDIEHIVTPDFTETIASLKRVPGVYTFWNNSNFPLYVGVSVDLSTRISSSFTERFRSYEDVIYLRYLAANTATDARVYEAAYIGTLKPALNTSGKYDDDLTIKIDLPELSHAIPVNQPGKKVRLSVCGPLVVEHEWLSRKPDQAK